MPGNRYGRGWSQEGRYGGDFGGRRGPVHGRGHGAGIGRYDAGGRGGYDRGWPQAVAYGREPGIGMGMNGAGMFTPFGWDPMLRWSGWAPPTGFVPFGDAPREGSYGLAEDHRRYDHEFHRGSAAPRYGGDYGPPRHAAEHRVPPRQSPLYGRGGDRALREWAAERGYSLDYTIQPRFGPRR